MPDYSLNPHIPNLGRPFEPPIYETHASPKYFCKWCGVESDWLHEERCELKPKGEKNESK